jgi:hypothetical protein
MPEVAPILNHAERDGKVWSARSDIRYVVSISGTMTMNDDSEFEWTRKVDMD